MLTLCKSFKNRRFFGQTLAYLTILSHIGKKPTYQAWHMAEYNFVGIS